jgi:hypothetical protein
VSDNKLVLHPLNPRAILQDPGLFMDTLRGLGLIGAGFSHVGELHYKAGPRLKELLTFNDSFPGGRVDPAQCHVSLMETTSAPVFLGASNVQTPLCPGCQAQLADWKQQLTAWQSERQGGGAWSCPKCGRRFPVERADWGHTAGVARYSLDVWGIRQNEAVPAPELLTFLENDSGEKWGYFFYRF